MKIFYNPKVSEDNKTVHAKSSKAANSIYDFLQTKKISELNELGQADKNAPQFSNQPVANKSMDSDKKTSDSKSVVNPETREILLVTTPRDAYVDLPWGSSDKLTHSGIWGLSPNTNLHLA